MDTLGDFILDVVGTLILSASFTFRRCSPQADVGFMSLNAWTGPSGSSLVPELCCLLRCIFNCEAI